MPWDLIAFLAVLLFHLAWIWQGFDVTDEGYNLTNQWLILNGQAHYEYGSIWLSDLVGGAWLAVVGNLGLIGARVGWALVGGCTGLIAFLVLRRFFAPGFSLLAVLATTAAALHHGVMVLTYNSIPALLLLGAAGLLLAVCNETRSRMQVWGSLSAGALLGLCVMARLPLVAALALPFVACLSHALFAHRAPTRRSWGLAGSAFLASLLAIGLCLTLLGALGHLKEYLDAIYRMLFASYAGSSHAPESLVAIFLGTTGQALLWGIRIVGAGAGMALVLALLPRRVRPPWLVGVLFGGASFALLHYFVGERFDFQLALPGIFFVLGLLELGVLAARGVAREEEAFPRSTLLLLALGLAVLLPLGSLNGMKNAKYELWLLIPATIALLADVLRTVSFSCLWRRLPGRVRRFRLAPMPVAAIGVAALMAVAGLGIEVRLHDPFRDLRTRRNLTTEIDYPRLRGVYTSSGRATSVTDVLRQLEELTEPGDVVLAYNSIPMVHYVTETIPALRNPWPVLMHPLELETRLRQLGSSGIPHVVVRANVNTRDRDWGTRRAPPVLQERALEGLRLLDGAILEWGHQPVWSSRDFTIYALPVGPVEPSTAGPGSGE